MPFPEAPFSPTTWENKSENPNGPKLTAGALNYREAWLQLFDERTNTLLDDLETLAGLDVDASHIGGFPVVLTDFVEGQVLKLNASGQIVNAADLLGSGGSGTGSLNIEKSDVLIVEAASVLDVSGAFSVSQSPTGEANLDVVVATEAQKGVAPLATQAQVNDGTLGALIVTPETLENSTVLDPKYAPASLTTALADHLADAIDAHAASAIAFNPTDTISAETVQAAIAEVAQEAAGAASDALSPLLYAEVAVSVATTLDSTAFGKMHVLTGTGYTVVLPTASGNAGKAIGLRVPASVAATVGFAYKGNGSELTNGINQRVLNAGESVTLRSDGANWHRISKVSKNLTLLEYAPTTDIVNAKAVSNTFVDLLTSALAFSVWDATSEVEVVVNGGVHSQTTGPLALSSRLVVDPAGTPIYRKLGGSFGYYGNYLTGTSKQTFSGSEALSAGAHALNVQLWSGSATAAYCRAGNAGMQHEHLRIQVIERKQ